MVRQHYHVTANTAGYLPDTNDYYETKRQAEAGMQWTKNQWLEGWPEATVKGSKRTGYRIDRFGDDPSSYTLPVYITIQPCTQECDPEAMD